MAERKIVLYKHYFNEFYVTLTDDVRNKLNNVLKLVKIADKIPSKFFKSITSIKGLFEIRMEWNNNAYRVFCCFDRGNIIVLFQGFLKKTQKTPKAQLEMAEKLMKEYFDEQTNIEEQTYGQGKKR